MCACRQKKSFFIDDILKDVSEINKFHKKLNHEPTLQMLCSRGAKANEITCEVKSQNEDTTADDDKITKFNVLREVQQELGLCKVNFVQRRNTFPLYPTPVKVNVSWPSYSTKESINYSMNARHPYSYCGDSILNSDHMLRMQLASNRFIQYPFNIRPPYGYPRVPMACCDPWMDVGVGGRRKSRQVRFSAAQTGALELRFSITKYLRPDERRDLALTLKLSDRQVKTWFQNRRAKWRRCTPDAADTGSGSHTEDEGSDYDVQIVDHAD